MTAGPPLIRLHLLPEALDRNGVPRAALVVPPSAARYDCRGITLLFPTIAAAVAAKRSMEATTPASRDASLQSSRDTAGNR